MTYIDNVHQPFVFKSDEYFHILITEIQSQKYEFRIRNSVHKDDKWKIKLLNENLDLINISTPTKITFQTIDYEIFSECSPFLYNSKMSYVATCYTEEFRGKVDYLLIQGDFNKEDFKLDNIKVVGKYYSAIIKDNEIISVDAQRNKIQSTEIFIPEFGSALDRIIRVMGIDGKKDLLITGIKDQMYKTLVWIYGTNQFFTLGTIDDVYRIYKSSIYGDGNDGVLVYTDKELPDNETKKYKLNITLGYKLI